MIQVAWRVRFLPELITGGEWGMAPIGVPLMVECEANFAEACFLSCRTSQPILSQTQAKREQR